MSTLNVIVCIYHKREKQIMQEIGWRANAVGNKCEENGMCEEKANKQDTTQAAVRCDQCMRIIAYRVVPGTGRIQIKCPKCGKEIIVDLSAGKVRD